MSDDGGVLVMFVLWAVGFVMGAVAVWVKAPPVGGEWWPYVRVVAVFVGGLIGGKIVVIGVIVLLFLVSILLVIAERLVKP